MYADLNRSADGSSDGRINGRAAERGDGERAALEGKCRTLEVALHCTVCGGQQVRIDEVETPDHREVLGLAECSRCEHRWLQSGPWRPVVIVASAGREDLEDSALPTAA